MRSNVRVWPHLLELGLTPQNIGEPFAGYADFDSCVAANQDKDNPEAYCAAIKRKAESGGGQKGIYPQSTENRAAMSRLDELGLVAFQMDARLAIPTISGNKRKWTEATLKGAIPHYLGKPVMLDHSQGTGDVVAVTTDAFWGPSKVRQEDTQDALRAHGIGLMDKALFEKLRTDGKNVIGVPLVKGVSIAGGADLEMDEEGNEIPTNFIPDEFSITPFPGIKEAEIERMVPIMESLRSKKTEGLKQKLQESQLPEFIPVFLLPLRGESCPEGYVLDPVGKTCEVPQQMAKLSPEIQEHLKKGAPGYLLISDPSEKALIYVKNEWISRAIAAVGETGKPPKDWWDRCVDGVTKSGGADDPASVCGNVWFNILGEWAKRRVAVALEKKVEFQLPPEAKEVFSKLADQLKHDSIKVPDNLFTKVTKDTMSPEEQRSFDVMLLDIERQKRGLPPIQEAEHGTVEPGPDGSCPEGYKMREDGMCHLQSEARPAKTEKVATQKIIEELTIERDRLQERAAKIDALKAERDQLQRKLENERSLWKAIEQGRRLPASLGKGKALTQPASSVETGKIENMEDSAALYNHYLQQGFSRREATQAVLLRVMEQEGLA